MWIFFIPWVLWNIFVRSKRRYTAVYIRNLLFSITVKRVRQNGHMIIGRSDLHQGHEKKRVSERDRGRHRGDTERESDSISAGCQLHHYCRWGLGRAVPLPLMICDCSLSNSVSGPLMSVCVPADVLFVACCICQRWYIHLKVAHVKDKNERHDNNQNAF